MLMVMIRFRVLPCDVDVIYRAGFGLWFVRGQVWMAVGVTFSHFRELNAASKKGT